MNFSDEEDSDHEEPQLESWVRIQRNTFTNWVNDKLRVHDLEVNHLHKDFKDGVKLCKLMEALKGKRIGRIIQKAKLNKYEASGNLQLAFNAMAKDGVRLVNIGAEDVTSGNIKLILGLLWTLIRRYQIGSQSKLPPKAMMLSWCNAVLHPHRRVNNFSTNWNDGIALHGLLDYCRPGSCGSWHQMSAADGLANTQHAMRLADEQFDIPMVMRPEDLADPDVDDLSVMTYLSYYMAEGSPGYKATLNWVRLQISPTPLDNFDKDWNNGFVLSSLVTSLGGQIPNWPELAADWTQANDNAIQAAETQLGIVPVLTGRDLINPEVDHIAVMAHAAWHEARSREPPVQQSRPETPPRQSTVIEITSETPPDLSADVIINATWRIDTIMTIEVDSSQLGPGNLALSAEAPSGARTHLNKSSINEYISHFEFTPTEKGLWDVHVLYNGRAVGRSPYEVNVYDSALAKISREYGVTNTNEQYTFEVDTSLVGVDDVSVYVVHEGATVPHDVTADGPGRVQVDFTPTEEGSYTVAVYCGGVEIPGSPFDIVCKVVHGVTASGSALTQGVSGKEASFDIDLSACPGRDLDVTVYGPSGQPVHSRVLYSGRGDLHKVNFTPKESGVHIIDILYGGLHINGSPFHPDFRRGKVTLQDVPKTAYVNKRSRFKIDASEVKKGTLEIDSDLPVVATDKLEENVYLVTIQPRQTGIHDLIIKYNDIIVEGCPLEVEVKKASDFNVR